MSESYQLIYFASWARSDVSLMALQTAGAKYEHIILNSSQWASIKAQQKFGQIREESGWHDPGEHLDASIWESLAIELYLGEKLGLLPTDPLDKAESISILSSLYSLRDMIANARNILSTDLRAAQHEKHITETIPEALKWHENIIAGPYFAGDSITLPDLGLLSQYLVFRDMYGDKNPLLKFPKIRVLVETLLAGKLGEYAVKSRKEGLLSWNNEKVEWVWTEGN
ncbi:hypothetical protein C8J56DRAFT_1073228 [Mycena floridula]|nr:hypothetical protein C8J56DRAFT_1073228 [Mycena floridula]